MHFLYVFFFFLFSGPNKKCLRWPQMVPVGFSTNPDLADIFGQNGFAFEFLSFFISGTPHFWISKSPDLQIPRFPGPQISRFPDAGAGVWKSGNLGTWKSGNLEIWGLGNPEMWGPRNKKRQKLKCKSVLPKNVGKVWISRKPYWHHLGPSEAFFIRSRK